jgi:hypothetical protein
VIKQYNVIGGSTNGSICDVQLFTGPAPEPPVESEEPEESSSPEESSEVEESSEESTAEETEDANSVVTKKLSWLFWLLVAVILGMIFSGTTMVIYDLIQNKKSTV